MRSTRRERLPPCASVNDSTTVHSASGQPASRALMRGSWKRRSRPSQARMSAGVSSRRRRTWPPGAAGRKSPWTWRKVTGSTACSPCSITPKGAAENLAIGGASPVATASGKLAALASGRPAASRRPAGSSIVKRAFSASGFGNCTCDTSAAVSSLSNTGANAAPVAGFRRTCCASARATGSEKRSDKGRTGRQGALARSRSQLNSAVKAGRTV